MQDEAEEPSTETGRYEPARAEILLIAVAWALFVVTLLASIGIWSGGSH